MDFLRALFHSDSGAARERRSYPTPAPLSLPMGPLLVIADFVRSHRTFCLVCKQWAEVAHQQFVPVSIPDSLQDPVARSLCECAIGLRANISRNPDDGTMTCLDDLPADTRVAEIVARFQLSDSPSSGLLSFAAMKRFQSLTRISIQAGFPNYQDNDSAKQRMGNFREFSEVVAAPSLEWLHLNVKFGASFTAAGMSHLLQGIPRLKVLELELPIAPYARIFELLGACQQATGLQRLTLEVGYSFPNSERPESPLQEPGLKRLASLPDLRVLKVSMGPQFAPAEVLAQLAAFQAGSRKLRALEVQLEGLAPWDARAAGSLAKIPGLDSLKLRLVRAEGDTGLRELRKGLRGNVQKLKGLQLRRWRLTAASVPLLLSLAKAMPPGSLQLLDCQGLSWCSRRLLRARGVVV